MPAAIRRRIKEIDERLGDPLPVYALFTKADLHRRLHRVLRRSRPRTARPGLGRDISAEQRAKPAPSSGFGAEFQLLVERLNSRLFDRLQAERSPTAAQPDRRLPCPGRQPAKRRSASSCTEAFGGSRLDPAPMLRGVYFTSGTQEGTPIDRLTGVLARTFGIDQRRVPTLRPEQGRSYFLARLLKEVIFGEAMLVSRAGRRRAAPNARPRRRLRGDSAGPAARRRGCCCRPAARTRPRSTRWRRRSPHTSRTASACRSTRSPMPTCRVSLPLLDQARALPHGVRSQRAAAGAWRPSACRRTAKLGVRRARASIATRSSRCCCRA